MPGATARFGFRFLTRTDPANTTRAVLQDNAETLEAGLSQVQGQVAQLATLLQPGGWAQGFIGLDTDGRPYVDPTGAVPAPARVGIDTDATPYVIDWTLT
jgi:hypothetical protein